MTLPFAASAVADAVIAGVADDVAKGATVAIVTVVVVIAVLLGAGIVLLFRRRSGAQPSSASGLAALRTRANILLVRADESVTAGEDELGFAVAQFGEARTSQFAILMTDARAKLAEAFRLQQALDDSVPESAQKQREWTLQIVALCEAAIAQVAGQDRDFLRLRGAEADSPARIAELRARVEAQRARLSSTPSGIDDPIAVATAALDAAVESLDDAGSRLTPSGVNTVSGLLEDAEGSLRRATAALDARDGLVARLEAATSALDALIASCESDLAEARTQRDAAPDADSGAAIIRAIAHVESARSSILAQSGPRNPVADLDALSTAVAELDTALATARNQAQRLEHARTALVAALVSAKSQIAALKQFVSTSGRTVGAEARTRLAEAERQLMLAETGAEADPIEALDAARRAVTFARDADALAHYDAMQRGR